MSMSTSFNSFGYNFSKALLAVDQAHGASRGGYSYMDGLMADPDLVDQIMQDPEWQARFAALPEEPFFWSRLVRLAQAAGFLKDESYCVPSSGWYLRYRGEGTVSTPFAGTWRIAGLDRSLHISSSSCPVRIERIG